MKKLNYLFIGLTAFTPLISLAFSLKDSTFKDIIDEVKGIIDILLPILVAVALIVFFWGLSKFILHSGNQADLEKGKNYMLWGILALFILLSYKAIVSLVATDLDIGDGTTVPYINALDPVIRTRMPGSPGGTP